MITSTGCIDLGSASEFAGADDDGLIKHFSGAQLADQRGEGRIENGILPSMGLVIVGVGVPALQCDGSPV